MSVPDLKEKMEIGGWTPAKNMQSCAATSQILTPSWVDLPQQFCFLPNYFGQGLISIAVRSCEIQICLKKLNVGYLHGNILKEKCLRPDSHANLRRADNKHIRGAIRNAACYWKGHIKTDYKQKA